MNEPVTVTYSLQEVLKGMDDKLEKMNERFDKIDERFTKIDERFDKIDERFTKIDERFTKIGIDMAEVKTELKGMNKRLDSQEFLNRSVAIGVIVALTTGVVKLFFPNFPNLTH